MILLVEDGEDDVFIMKRALLKSSVKGPLQAVSHGREAVDYLEGEGKFADRDTYPLPAVIFLDLKMPVMTGFEVLRWKRARTEFDCIPVVVLTSSPEERDRTLAQDLGAKLFLIKPPTSQMIEKAMLQLLPSS